MTPQEEFLNFISQYIDKYSPFKVNQQVLVKNFNTSNRPYLITKINVSPEGELFYVLISPRSFSTLPNKFKINELDLFAE